MRSHGLEHFPCAVHAHEVAERLAVLRSGASKIMGRPHPADERPDAAVLRRLGGRAPSGAMEHAAWQWKPAGTPRAPEDVLLDEAASTIAACAATAQEREHGQAMNMWCMRATAGSRRSADHRVVLRASAAGRDAGHCSRWLGADVAVKETYWVRCHLVLMAPPQARGTQGSANNAHGVGQRCVILADDHVLQEERQRECMPWV